MRRRIALLAGLVLAASLTLVLPRALAAPGCSVGYTVVNQWSNGFQTDVKITNLGDPLSSWTLGFDFVAPDTMVAQGWSATWSQAGTRVTAVSMSWNASLPTGAAVSIGFVGSGTNPAATGFTVNGVACNGGAATTTTGGATTTTGGATTTTRPATTTSTTMPATTTTMPGGTGTAPRLHVSGNRLVDAAGNTVRLLGVNRSGGEFMCVQGRGIWDGPVDDAAINAMLTWRVRAVRVPLNEECWLGLPNIQPQFAGATYQNEVKGFVSRLEAHGITPILEMHWSHGQYTGNASGCADVAASCQKPMPDAEFAPSFWTGVANTFKNDTAVVFDLFNEPFPDFANNFNATQAWTCWRDGGTCAGISFQVAGFQSLVNAVRATGATNVILIGGVAFSNDETQWLQFKPSDPTGNLGASWHSYNFNACSNSGCWNQQIAPVAAQVPLVAGEIGENDCAHGYIDSLMSFLDGRGASYLGWTWNAWDCSSGPALISDYNGTATNFGVGLRSHLLAT